MPQVAKAAVPDTHNDGGVEDENGQRDGDGKPHADRKHVDVDRELDSPVRADRRVERVSFGVEGNTGIEDMYSTSHYILKVGMVND